MNCSRFKLSVNDYLEDQLDRDERRSFRNHLQACVQCREDVVADEPSLLLVSGAPMKADERAADQCADAVAALIRQDRLHRQLAPSPRRWLAVAAVCVIVLGGGLVWRMAPWGADVQAPAVVAEDSPGSIEGSDPPPRVEVEMPGSEVRIYQYAGSDTETTAAFFVVNEKLEL